MRAAPTRCCAGFGLVDLMIGLAIAAILASIAVPTYGAYMTRLRRAQGRAALVQTAQWLERAAIASGVYPRAEALPPALFRNDDAFYRIEITTDDTTYRLRAVPQGTQARDPCGTLVLLHTGERLTSDATDATVDACWNR